MIQATEFFRHCPSCGRRFHVKFENIEKIRDEKKTIRDKPIIVEEKEFEYTYRCDHCGHEWTEHHEKIHKEHTNPTVEFLRHCPACGQRSDIKLEERKMIHDEKRIVPTKRAVISNTGNYSASHTGGGSPAPTQNAIMVEGKPIVLEEKEFQYTYKCGQCGHEWTVHHHEEHREC